MSVRSMLLPASEKRRIVNLRGEVLITARGASQWVCPPGVTKVSMALVSAGMMGAYSGTTVRGGAGGTLRFKNDIDVVPGQTYDIFVGRGDSSNSAARSSAFGIVAYPTGGGTSTNAGQNGVQGFGGGPASSFISTVNVIPPHGDPASFFANGGVAPLNTYQENANGLDLDGGYGVLEPYGKSGYYFLANGSSHGISIGRNSNGHDVRYQRATDGAVRIVWGNDRSFPNNDVAYG